MSKPTRRTRRTQIEEREAPQEAADKIRKLDTARVVAENEVSKTVENVALGMGLTREKGKTAWSYDVPSGKFSRRSLPGPTSRST